MFRRITGMTPLEYRRKTAKLVFEGANLTPFELPISTHPLPHDGPSTSGSFNTDAG
jgi:hypothetical protein